MQIKKFKDLKNEEIINYLNQIKNYNIFHTPAIINYQLSIRPECKNLSFFCLDKNVPLAFVPLGIIDSSNIKKISLGNDPCQLPIINNDMHSDLKKKVLDEIYKKIYLILKENDVDYADFFYHPVFVQNLNLKTLMHITYQDSFSILKYFNMKVVTNNTNIIDLAKDRKVLEMNLQSRKRKEFRKTFYQKAKLVAVNKNNFSLSEIELYFDTYKKIHFEAAKRKTRTEDSWKNNLEMIKDGNSTLFFLNIGGKLLSGLICLDFYQYSLAYSQATIKNNDYSKYSIRSFLEWKVINYYKDNKFKFYEIGTTYYYDQNHHNANDDKHKRIGELKTRFGANMFPRHYFRISKKFNSYFDNV